jgi:hypothetical protein
VAVGSIVERMMIAHSMSTALTAAATLATARQYCGSKFANPLFASVGRLMSLVLQASIPLDFPSANATGN